MKKGFTLIELLYAIAIVLVVGIICARLMGGLFVPKQVAVEALETQGYSDITITDKSWFFVSVRGCGGSDDAKFDAMAVNPAGNKVHVFVCTGWLFKGATIRS